MQPLRPENGEGLEDQLSEIDRMNSLLSAPLTLALLDAKRLEAGQEPFHLSVVPRRRLDAFSSGPRSRVRLEVDVPELLPACGDPERTGQILAALLDSAARHTPEGGTITISGRLLDGLAKASVGDTETGIPPEYMERIFDRFYRAEEARTRAGGTGLGLSIARDLAHAQGGTLSAENIRQGQRPTMRLSSASGYPPVRGKPKARTRPGPSLTPGFRESRLFGSFFREFRRSLRSAWGRMVRSLS